jgi:hypothetical protein
VREWIWSGGEKPSRNRSNSSGREPFEMGIASWLRLFKVACPIPLRTPYSIALSKYCQPGLSGIYWTEMMVLAGAGIGGDLGTCIGPTGRRAIFTG